MKSKGSVGGMYEYLPECSQYSGLRFAPRWRAHVMDAGEKSTPAQ